MRTLCRSSLVLTGMVASALMGCGGGGRYANPDVPPVTPGDTIGLTSSNRLVTFNLGMPGVRTAVAVTGLQTGETILGIDTRPGGATPGELYALGSTGRVYTVNVNTGSAALKSTLSADATDTTNPFTALNGANFGVDFNPVVDRLRVISDTGQNLRINVDTGATITDGGLNVGGTARTGVSATAYTNTFAAACRTMLFYLDSTTDRLFNTTDPNNGVLTDVGALTVNADAINNFDIVTSMDGVNTGYAVLTQGGGQAFHSINLTTGQATMLNTVSGLNAGETLRALAFATLSAAPAQTRGDVLALTASNRVVSFTNAAPQKLCTSVAISGLQTGQSALGMDLRPADGALYALGSTGRVYTVDPLTGIATMRSTLIADAADTTSPFTTLSGTEFGVDFNPVPDRLRVVSDTGQNLRINVDTGATTTDTAVNPTGSTIAAAAYTNSFAGADTTSLYVLDVANDRLMLQGQPSGNPNNGDLQAVGALGASGDVQAVSGFDIDGRNSTAFAALTIGAATTSELHNINLTTGAATRINVIGGGERIRGLALATRPQATVMGVTADNRLVSFSVTTPGTLATNTAISGLQGGENIVGADFRPANGRLYALTDAGRVYSIDPATAVASAPMAFVADAADVSAPYSALSGAAFGVDFNPVPDRLRTVSDAEQNLRSNVDTGATTTDLTLNRPFTVTAAAYTNSFSGATATTLFVIDSVNDRLLTQNPPNNGTLNEVGALGLDVEAVNAFEIVGPDTALALFAAATTPAALYRVNLTTGAATLVGAIPLAQSTDRIGGVSGAPSMTTPAANSTLFAVVNGSSLISFARNAPGIVSGSAAITGLPAAETILGIDFRPATGVLYGLGSTGRLYTVDTTTGAATLAATLAADAADLTDPFTALSGVNFGVDFNPVPDRLRVVSNTGQNLRINVTTGAVTTDGALNYPVDAIAAAYARNFAGTTATSLYVIDIASNTLNLQNPPNDGVLATIGRLDAALTFTSTGGFDIAGGDDGLAIAVLQPAAATQSSLYRINLRTGTATTVGPVGPAGTPLLRGLAIRLQ